VRNFCDAIDERNYFNVSHFVLSKRLIAELLGVRVEPECSTDAKTRTWLDPPFGILGVKRVRILPNKRPPEL
jgi:hypothetical protein